MDPVISLSAILENLHLAERMEPGEDREDAIGNAIDGMRDLATWLERGGFAPDVRRAVALALPNYLEDIRDAARSNR